MNFKIEYKGSSRVIKKICEKLNMLAPLGTTHDSAFYGDMGKEAYEHAQMKSGNPHNLTAEDIGLGHVAAQLETIMYAIGMIRYWYTHENEPVKTHEGDFIVFHGVNAENYNYLTWH